MPSTFQFAFLQATEELLDFPVTIFFLVLNVCLYAFPIFSGGVACLGLQVYTFKEWYRLLLSPVHHLNRKHIVFNMMCLLVDGTWLERRMGGRWLLYLLCVFSLLSGLVYLLLQVLLAQLRTSYECFVGFSNVLFGLSVLKFHYDPDGVINLWGFPVRNRYVVWAELFLSYVINPNSTLIGHLSGILVGLLYTKGPLETMMRMCLGLMFSAGIYTRRLYRFIAGRAFGVRFWAGEEVRLNELRDNRLRRFEDAN